MDNFNGLPDSTSYYFEADPVPNCRNCDLEPAFEGFDDCLKCSIACEIAENNGESMARWRKHKAGTEWLAQVEREYARQRPFDEVVRSVA